MNNKQLCLATLLTAFTVGSAAASSLCDVAESDRQPIELLQQMLENEGWQVKNIKVDDGCYEAYAIDTSGARVEAYFDPQTFELIKSEKNN
ncbi:MAG: PepSY domain-containing protein [Granulosicoccus sp.]